MTHTEYAEGLRQVAAFVESHPEIPIPEATISCYRMSDKKIAALVARVLSNGGRCDKVFEPAIIRLERIFGAVKLQYIGLRENVCEQVRVGTRLVPERYVPPQPATEGQVIPEHEEAVYEWRCAPLLGKPQVEIPEEKALTSGAEMPVLEAEYVDIPF